MSGTLIIPVGIPGSGKSAWTRALFPSDGIVSTDAIRLRLFDSAEAAHAHEVKDANNALVFDSFHKEILFGLAQDKTVVADATNLNHGRRATLREIAEDWHAKTHLVLFMNIDHARMRNARRTSDDHVSEDRMDVMVAKYQNALLRLPQERYDLVTKVRSLDFG